MLFAAATDAPLGVPVLSLFGTCADLRAFIIFSRTAASAAAGFAKPVSDCAIATVAAADKARATTTTVSFVIVFLSNRQFAKRPSSLLGTRSTGTTTRQAT